jgi:NitT/TauT family transport system substrate-binding protein
LPFVGGCILLFQQHWDGRPPPASKGTRAVSRVNVMSVWRSGRPVWAGLLLAALLVSGARAAEINIKFSLDRGYEGPAAPFLLALDQGYFKSEGLNVSIDPGSDPLDPIKRIASGVYDMGFADVNTLIKFRDGNPKMPIIAVFMVYNKPAYAIISRKSRSVIVPKDLEGKKLGAPPNGYVFAQWPIFAKVNNIDVSKVTIENVALPVRDPMLAAGQVDAITGLSFDTYVDLKDKGVPVNDINVMLMGDYGVDLYGNAIIVAPKFAAAHPDAVRGFLRAFLKGLKQTIRSPADAIDGVLRRADSGRKNLELERLNIVIRDNILTPEVKADGFGGIDTRRFARAIEQLAIAYPFRSARPKPGDIFDSSYLPSSDARQVN